MEKTLTEILDELRQEGYSEDFNLHQNCIECRAGEFRFLHDQFHVEKFYRLEGETDPSEEVVVYAIAANNGGMKGVLVNSYGIYADPIASEMLQKLSIQR